MAEITRPAGTGVSVASLNPPATSRISGLVAGENLTAGDVCYISASDGAVYKSTGAAANAAAKFRGMAMETTDLGQPVTLFLGGVMRYANALSPGANLFVSGVTAGNLADAASTGGTLPIGFVIDAQRIYVYPGAEY